MPRSLPFPALTLVLVAYALTTESCSPAATQPLPARPRVDSTSSLQERPRQAVVTAPTAGPIPAPEEVTAPTEIATPQSGDIGRQAPTVFEATGPAGHWTVVCEALQDTDHSGDLSVRLTQHGEFEGDVLKHTLYSSGKATAIDEYAGSDPSGRFVAYVKDEALQLLDTRTDKSVKLNADIRATQASFQALRSVTFSDNGKWIAYANIDTKSVVVRGLADEHETTYPLPTGELYRLQFAPGSRFVKLEIITVDSNKNGKLQWLLPKRTAAAPCPSPIPAYNVWQFPGDTPTAHLLDLKAGGFIVPQGFTLAAGNLYVQRTEDQRLLAIEPNQPARAVSSSECMGRVLHVDLASGNLVFGCASAWGQRRDMFLRTSSQRIQLNFDLAGFELDARIDTNEPNLPFYPGNASLIFNTRTRERWLLDDGTQVLTIHGNTALVEQNSQLTLRKLNPDASNTVLTKPIQRAPFAEVIVQLPWAAVGAELFQLAQGYHQGTFPADDGPLALSVSGQGLYPSKSATPTSVSLGPLRWHSVL